MTQLKPPTTRMSKQATDSKGKRFRDNLSTIRLKDDNYTAPRCPRRSVLTLALALEIFVFTFLCTVKRVSCDASSEFRAIDGTWNNINSPFQGAANTTLTRLTAYFNWTELVQNGTVPSARSVSASLRNLVPESLDSPTTSLLFLSFLILMDIVSVQSTSSASYIAVPRCDSQLDPTCTGTAQLPYYPYASSGADQNGAPTFNNTVTSQLDVSFLYGCSNDSLAMLRSYSHGMLNLTDDGFLQTVSSTSGPMETFGAARFNSMPLFLAGDSRVNRHIGTQVLVNLLAREHNRMASTLLTIYPYWSDETLFQYARQWIIDIWQMYVTKEWLPFFTGGNYERYVDYNSTASPVVSVDLLPMAALFGFSGASSSIVPRDENGNQISAPEFSLRDTFYNTTAILKYGLEPFLIGMATSPMQSVSAFLNTEMQTSVFGMPFDPFATIIQKSRDAGVGPWSSVRQVYPRQMSFQKGELMGQNIEQIGLSQVYLKTSSASPVDAAVEAIAQARNTPVALCGPVLMSALADQVTRIRNSDRFYFESSTAGYSEDKKNILLTTPFASIVTSNTNLQRFPKDPFTCAKSANYFNMISCINTSYTSFSISGLSNVSWTHNSTHMLFNACLNYTFGYFSIGFGNLINGQLSVIEMNGQNNAVNDYMISNKEIMPSYHASAIENSFPGSVAGNCQVNVNFSRTMVLPSNVTNLLSYDSTTKLSKLLWMYSLSIPAPFYLSYTDTGSFVAQFTDVKGGNDASAQVSLLIKWPVNVAFYHGAVLIIISGALYPFNILCTVLSKTYFEFNKAVLHLYFWIVLGSVFLIALALLGAGGAFKDPHSVVGLLGFALLLCDLVIWKMKQRSQKQKSVLDILRVTAITFALIFYVTSCFIGITVYGGLAQFAGAASTVLTVFIVLAALAVYPTMKFANTGQESKKAVDEHHGGKGLKFQDLIQVFCDYCAQKRKYAELEWDEINDRVENGYSLAVINSKIIDLRPIYEAHPGGANVLLSTIGADITKIMYGKFGMQAREKIPKNYNIVRIANKIKRSSSTLINARTSFGMESIESVDYGNDQDVSFEQVSRIRNIAINKFRAPHSSNAFMLLEGLVVGKLVNKSSEAEGNMDQVPKQYQCNWATAEFPDNGAVPMCALDQKERRVAIFCGAKELFSVNEESGQAAYCFRFAFENERDEVWFRPGDSVVLSVADRYGRALAAHFTPTVCHAEGFLDLYIKLYKGQKMSEVLGRMQPGDLATLRGPVPGGTELVRSSFSLSGCADKLVLLCAGSGVTLCAQLIDYYLSFGAKTDEGEMISQIALMCFNKNEHEIMMAKEIETLRRYGGGKIEVFFCHTRSPRWNGPKGYVSQALLETTVFRFVNHRSIGANDERVATLGSLYAGVDISVSKESDHSLSVQTQEQITQDNTVTHVIVCGPPRFKEQCGVILSNMQLKNTVISII